MGRRNIRFAGLLALAVAFSGIAWLGDPKGRAVWLGLSVVFLVLAIATRRRDAKCDPVKTEL
jgi:hypothetical protein